MDPEDGIDVTHFMTTHYKDLTLDSRIIHVLFVILFLSSYGMCLLLLTSPDINF